MNIDGNQVDEHCLRLVILEEVASEKLKVSLTVESCLLNWKPDSLLVLRSLYLSSFPLKPDGGTASAEALLSPLNTLLEDLLREYSAHSMQP